MDRILEEISFRTHYTGENNEPIDICSEGYRLTSGVEVLYIGGKWLDHAGHEYTPVSVENTDSEADKRLIGFVQRDTLDDVVKKILSKSPEGAAYVRYNERIGGDRIGLSVPNGYPNEVQRYLDEGHTLEEIYEECTNAGITWYEMFSLYPVDSIAPDMQYERVYW